MSGTGRLRGRRIAGDVTMHIEYSAPETNVSMQGRVKVVLLYKMLDAEYGQEPNVMSTKLG